MLVSRTSKVSPVVSEEQRGRPSEERCASQPGLPIRARPWHVRTSSYCARGCLADPDRLAHWGHTETQSRARCRINAESAARIRSGWNRSFRMSGVRCIRSIESPRVLITGKQFKSAFLERLLHFSKRRVHLFRTMWIAHSLLTHPAAEFRKRESGILNNALDSTREACLNWLPQGSHETNQRVDRRRCGPDRTRQSIQTQRHLDRHVAGGGRCACHHRR